MKKKNMAAKYNISIEMAMSGVGYVFQASALKQVSSNEFFSIDVMRTNVFGTQNVTKGCNNGR